MTESEAKEQLREERAKSAALASIIADCQSLLTDYLVPGGTDEQTTLNKLLEILDGPRWRAAKDI